jgi:hypothetical protein
MCFIPGLLIVFLLAVLTLLPCVAGITAALARAFTRPVALGNQTKILELKPRFCTVEAILGFITMDGLVLF